MSFDLIVALIIAGIALLVFVISQFSILPNIFRKNILFILGSVAAAFGITLFARHRIKLINNELKEKEDKLKVREKEINNLKGKYQQSENELYIMKAKLQDQLDAYKKVMLQIDAKTKKEKKRIDGLYGDELHRETLAVLKKY